VTPLQQGYPDTLAGVTVVGERVWTLEAQFAAMRGGAGVTTRPFKVVAAPLH
jgi:hypothetical protein